MKKIAVIGSGFGGIATAIRLQAAGNQVTLFEKRALPGGRAYVYHQDGFTFDAGPTVVTAPNCLEELFALSNRNMKDYIEMTSISPMYRLHWEDGTTFDYTDNLEKTLAQISQFSEEDANQYPKFLDYSRKVFEAGYEDLAHVPFLDWSSMIRVSPELVKLQAYRTVYGIVAKYIKSPKLREAFSFHSLLVGGNPFTASAIYTLIHYLERKWGVYFPKGGTHALIRALCRLFEDLGGNIRTNVEIAEITTANARVTGIKTLKGDFEGFDAVVSNADVARTYCDLLKTTPEAKQKAKQLTNSKYSMSLFLIYFGTNKTYPHLAHHNVIFGKRYKGLLNDIFKKGHLADDFSLYLHVPTRTDKSLAPEGCETFYALSPVPHLGKLDIDWDAEGKVYADKILNYLDERYLPGLKQSIVTQKIFTPRDFATELNAHLGSAFSLEPLLTQSAYWRVHNRDERVAGLYFAGAGTHPGAGIPGVVNSAKATATLMLEDFAAEQNAYALKNTAEDQKVLDQCEEMIRVGSKSFSLASKLFEKDTRAAACFLYGWCRYCDDQIDDITDPALQSERINRLRTLTADCFGESQPPSETVFIALGIIAKKFRIPSHYALELIEGLVMDAKRETYETPEELSLYCYRVAGTVGLMMSHVMGVSDEKALRHASDLGIAMQLTNIARDVMDDAAMGRVYLPLEWLRASNIPAQRVSQPQYRQEVFKVVERLLRLADSYYTSGNSGLKYLPWRAALAVSVASSVYSQIGALVLERGSRAWDKRAVVSPFGKGKAVITGLLRVIRTLPYRLLAPWKRIHAMPIWKYQFLRPEESTS